MQLEGARLLADRTDADPRLTAQIENAGRLARDGMASARSAIATLRGEVLPGPADLPALIEQAGIPVRYEVTGEPRPLPADAALAVYRAVQEALTNATKYGGTGVKAGVTLRWSPSEVVAEVVDAGGDRVPAGLPSGGYGLAGLAERAALAGGRSTPGRPPTAGASRSRCRSALRVLVADDQKVVRDGLALLLGLLDGIEVVGTAIDGADAVRQAVAADPDVVLMDLNMPTMDGVEATRALAAKGARARVVVLTTYSDDDWVFRRPAGRRPRLPHQGRRRRGDPRGDRGGRRRRRPARPVRAAPAAGRAAAGARLGVPPRSRPDGLTPREAEVLAVIAEGLSNAEVAARLHVSEATVKTHVNHLLAKTGARDRAALVTYAFRTGRAGG